MQVFIVEDDAVPRLGVLVAARPACDLTIGATSLHDALGGFGTVQRVLRPHLAAHLAALAGTRVAFWGAASDPPSPPPLSRHGALALLVNARAVPSRDNLLALRSLVEAGRRTIVREADAIAAAVLHLAADGDGPDDALARRLRAEGPRAMHGDALAALPAADARLELLDGARDVVGAHERALEGALAIRLDGGRYREVRPNLFAAAGATVADQVAVRQGPVIVEAGAEIGPFVCLDGPLLVGPRTRVNPHAWLRPGTVLGADCRAGGEIEATVMERFSNKPHDGFLGHSHVGSWVNLAAGTITSNLKATYGPVRLHERRPDGSRISIDTGRQFFGGLIGDLVRTAINTSIPCGARIGIAAAVQGRVAESVPAFSNDLLGSPSTAEQAATVLGRMMARRGLPLLDADRALLGALAGG
ncbi:hypothetical protein EBR56_02380 [bacterium]|nr:hypothetical protein [bacterium]